MQEEGPGVGIMGRALGCHAAAQTFSGRGVIISTCMSHDAFRCLSTTLNLCFQVERLIGANKALEQQVQDYDLQHNVSSECTVNATTEAQQCLKR